MKKIITVLVLLLVTLASSAFGEVPFYNSNQFLLTWNAVTQDMDGDALIGTVGYKIYLADAIADPNKLQPNLIETVTAAQTTVTLVKGKFYWGVSAFVEDMESEITWADTQDTSAGYEQFGLRYAVPPKMPSGLER